MPSLLICLVSLVVSCSTLIASTALADDAADQDLLIEQAVQEFAQAHWEEARALFRRVHAVAPSARTWRALGITAFELRRYVDAVAELEAALADPRKPVTATQRGEIEALLVRTREFVSVYRVEVRPQNATVVVDGKPVALSDGQLYLDPGDHTISAHAPGYEEVRENLRADAGSEDQLSIVLRIASEPLVAAQPRSAASHTDEPAANADRRLWTWVLGGTALAAGSVGVGLGIGARSKHDAYQQCEADCEGLRSKGRSLALGSTLALGTAGALLGGAVVAYLVEGRTHRVRSVAAFVRPMEMDVRVSF